MAEEKFNVKFNIIPETLESPFKEDFPAHTEGLVRSDPGGFAFHPCYVPSAEKIYGMNIRSDDVWIRTFPRSGESKRRHVRNTLYVFISLF